VAAFVRSRGSRINIIYIYSLFRNRRRRRRRAVYDGIRRSIISRSCIAFRISTRLGNFFFLFLSSVFLSNGLFSICSSPDRFLYLPNCPNRTLINNNNNKTVVILFIIIINSVIVFVYPLRDPTAAACVVRPSGLASSSRGVYFRRAVYAVFTIIIYSRYYNVILCYASRAHNMQ